MDLEINVNTTSLGEAQEFVEGYKSCTKEVIDFLLINCQSNDEALTHLIGKIVHLTRDFEKKLRTDSRPIRNLQVLDKVRRKILDKRRKQQRRALAYQQQSHDTEKEEQEFVWRPFQ